MGYSLGGGLASLFYARVRDAQDLPEYIEVCGAYTFGQPRVANLDFRNGCILYQYFINNHILIFTFICNFTFIVIFNVILNVIFFFLFSRYSHVIYLNFI
jgi:Lipase (class 3)